jgi:hypothetical protein
MQVFVGAKRTARWLGLKENELSPQEKLVRRRKVIKPGFDAFKEWAETHHKNVLTKELLAEHYTIPSTNFPPLIPFLKMSGFNSIIIPLRTRLDL